MPLNTGSNPPPSSRFPIVAIGASAGGFEAVCEIFSKLTAPSNLCFVCIQYDDPTLPANPLADLQQCTSLPVSVAEEGVRIEPNRVYLLEAGRELNVVDHHFVPSKKEDGTMQPVGIDQLFVSLADHQQDAAIGVLLSGTVSDGVLGLKAIKAAGGITFAQDLSARYQTLPRSAIAEGVVDKVLPPAQIADELLRLASQSAVMLQARGEGAELAIEDGNEDLLVILQLLRKSAGVDFTHYKMNTIKRRIIRRMLLVKLSTLKDYVLYLKQHANEVTLLYQDLLINVTSFFRDPDTLEFLKKTIIPRIIKSKSPSDPIRIWVPACSTGEEAYSLAMIFMEVLGERAANTSIQIFATDLSELTIAKARLGLYSRNDVANVSPRRLQRFFSKIDGNYRIVKSIRDLCVFAPHNMFKDPPFSRIDLISCCNLMIYLDNVLQKKILATFHYALNTDGYLVLGKSETVSASLQLFSPLEKKFKVFLRNKEKTSHALFEMNYRLPEIERNEASRYRKPHSKASDPSADLEKMVDSVLLSRYVPASVVVNGDLDIVQFRGSTGLYLEPSPGKASLNLLKMARPGLAFELRNTVHKVSKSGQSVKKTGLELRVHNTSHLVSIEVSPLRSESEEKFFLVVFEQMPMPELEALRNSYSKDKLVKQLEEELRVVKEDMRSIIEEQEASNEELQSANEEIVSSNEELQSINEELETSKEELESANEELMTINAELQVRNEQLAEAYEYAESVFGIIREAVLVLDKDLRVRSANAAFYRTFRLKEEDMDGVVLFELANRQWDIPRLRQLLQEELPRQFQVEGLEITHDFEGIGKKVMLINACQVVKKTHQQQLVLLAIEDITELRKK